MRSKDTAKRHKNYQGNQRKAQHVRKNKENARNSEEMQRK